MCYHCKKLGHRRDQCPQLVGNNSARYPQTITGRQRDPRNQPRDRRPFIRTKLSRGSHRKRAAPGGAGRRRTASIFD